MAALSPVLASDKELDVSKGSFAGYVWFVYSAEGSDFAGVAIGRLPEARMDRNFALSGGKAEPLEIEKVAEMATEGRKVLAVKVGPRHYDETRHLIYRWAQKDHGAMPPAMVCEDLIYQVAHSIEVKAPYRGAFTSSDPAAYLRDLDRINR